MWIFLAIIAKSVVAFNQWVLLSNTLLHFFVNRHESVGVDDWPAKLMIFVSNVFLIFHCKLSGRRLIWEEVRIAFLMYTGYMKHIGFFKIVNKFCIMNYHEFEFCHNKLFLGQPHLHCFQCILLLEFFFLNLSDLPTLYTFVERN